MKVRVPLMVSLTAAWIAVCRPASAATDDDPHKGVFTMEEATAGLQGSGQLIATIETPKGTLSCELFDKQAPLTVANFVGLARGLRAFVNANTGQWEKKPHYDGLLFHRVIPGFMIQGGDFMGTGSGTGPAGKSPGYKFNDEISADLKFDKKGLLAMANTGPRTNTNGSQFFITDGTPRHLDGNHTIFGQCGPLKSITEIATVATGPRNRPLQDVIMKKVTIAYKKSKATAKTSSKAEK